MGIENFFGTPTFESLETQLAVGTGLGPEDDSDCEIASIMANLEMAAMCKTDYIPPVTTTPIPHNQLAKAAPPNTTDLDEDAAEAIFALDLKTLLVPGSGITPQPVPAHETLPAPLDPATMPNRFTLDPELTLHKRKRRAEMSEAELKLDDAMDAVYCNLIDQGESAARARELAGYLRGTT